jgi:hypothetical protein
MCVAITVITAVLLRYFGPCRIIVIIMCIVITCTIVRLLRDFGPYGMTSMNVCVINVVMVCC